MTVFTIGYEGMGLEEFLDLLREHQITTVVDVRELPLSRKPGFSKTTLAEALGDASIGYVHMADLGCPKAVRIQYRLDGDWAQYVAGFTRHLVGQDDALAALAARAKASKCALLCFEADPGQCHRSLVADAVKKKFRATVRHLTSQSARRGRAAPGRGAIA